ncbi:hypothetical protein [Epilithonimonas xixisoli]|uniref:Uncharacterized protein n=1 Tax=Epilithonimonas xixisoli TaxID=1476462 RepID=A0A4R8I9J1_9FLAO|nr:hypothetical protein [Epilithonimonas xixisoli]TDX83322.1 hypothetical protein B0I22_3402 [Epilithonimonas xixisoli]
MKTKLLLLLVLWIGVVWGQESQEEIIVTARKMGFVAYLTQLKTISEVQMSELVNNPQYTLQTDKAKDINLNYNLLKINVDILINQLCADLSEKNSLRVYKLINKNIKKDFKLPKKYSYYEDCVKNIKKLSGSLAFKDYSSKSGASLADWASVGTLILDVVKINGENNQKKVDKITTIFCQLRLKDINELKKK